jgi:A/G-specific adenine glycosylase
VVAHYASAQRDLPWRRTRDPYAIWISEIMLQQTRVATVIPYWERWLARFPSVAALAAAPLDDVLAAWAGLGYYSRARNLHAGARAVVERWGGAIPATAAELRGVPGIGPYTAGAIASIAFGERAPLVDGNVARVLARVFAIEVDVKATAGQRAVWERAGALMAALPARAAPGALNQGLMELGATLCTPRSPRCQPCPLAGSCEARRAGRQGELPRVARRPAARELPRIERTLVWIERRGALVLARRRADGLFGGLWELPERTTVLALGGTVEDAPVAYHEQTLTHRRLQIAVVRGRLARSPRGARDPSYDELAWVALARAGTLGVAAATTAILRRYADAPWTSPRGSSARPSATPPRPPHRRRPRRGAARGGAPRGPAR